MVSSLRRRKVGDIMSKEVVTVSLDAPMKEVLDLMTLNGITAIVVVDEKNYSSGLISSFDVIGLFNTHSLEEIEGLKARDVMTKHTIDVDPKDTLDTAARIMREFRVHRLVVLGSGKPGKQKPIGILSTGDLVSFLNTQIG